MTTPSDAARRRFRPTLWPTVFTALTLPALIALGTWQVHRLYWKEDLIASRAAALAAAPVAIDALDRNGEITEFRRVRAIGAFLHDHEMLLDARSHLGRPGAHVVTPLRLVGGGIVLVDRGWVPREFRDPRRRAAGQVAGRIEVVGILRRGGRPSDWLPENRPPDDLWFYVDPPQMAARAGLSGVRPYFVEAGPAPNPGGWPLGGRTRTELPNNHLQYAVTWYALAVVLGVIYVVYHLRRDTEE